MFTYRGIRIDNNELIEGYFLREKGYSCIQDKYDEQNIAAVYPRSLAINTLVRDKNDKYIFANFPLNNGQLTQGCDIVHVVRDDGLKDYTSGVYYSDGIFWTYPQNYQTTEFNRPRILDSWTKEMEIIGTQFEKE
ncbi:MAG: hypothetical protein ACOC22_03490 [bacterium]